MPGASPSGQLRARLLRGRFSETQIRRALQRELPELLPDLPGPGASFGDFAFHLVEGARRREYTEDVEALLASMERRSTSLRRKLFGALALASAGAVFVAGRAVRELPQDSGGLVEASAPTGAEPRTSSLAAGPEARPAPAPVTMSRPTRARRRPAVESQAMPEPEASARATEDALPGGSHEPSSGEAACRGRSCRLTADSGQFHRSEEFCVVPAGVSEVKRCIIHGELVHPAPTIECDLSEAQLEGVMHWRRCLGAL